MCTFQYYYFFTRLTTLNGVFNLFVCVLDPSGSLTTSPIRAASEIQAFRNVVLKDIIDSEKAHVAEMQGLVTNFLQPLEKSEM